MIIWAAGMVQVTMSPADIGVDAVLPSPVAANMEALRQVVLELMLEHRRVVAVAEDLAGAVERELRPEQTSAVAFVTHALRKAEVALAEAVGEIEILRASPGCAAA
jgi:hypothetical protein